MTTIAWNEDTIAWESRIQTNGMNFDTRVPKVRVFKNKIYAFAGDMDAADHMIVWEQDGCDVDAFFPDTEWTLVVWEKDQDIAFYSHFVPVRSWSWPVHAIGTGSMIAIAAMRAGADPRRAVEIACDLDPNSGGEIHTLSIKDALGGPVAGKNPIRVIGGKK